jgi:hypothetical protein
MIDKFKNIFEGLTIAYGQYQKGEKGENGKQKGKAFIVRQQVTRELFENHIKGVGPALGIIPITEKNDCKWGCIDIDEYNLDHKSLISNIRKLNLPLIVCRSKSGGAHVFLFAKEYVSASLMQNTLKKILRLMMTVMLVHLRNFISYMIYILADKKQLNKLKLKKKK